MIAERLANMLNFRAGPATPGPTDPFWYGPAPMVSGAGRRITTDAALRVATVLACVRVLAEAIAMLPLHLYRRLGEGRTEIAADDPLDHLLHSQPNVWQTAMEWREQGMWHILLRGNWYNRIVLGADGQIEQLVPLHPDRVKVQQLPNGRLRYIHSPVGMPKDTFTQDEILHLRGPSPDGITGISLLEYARNAIGLSASEETSGASLFENGGVFHYVLETAKRLGPDGRDNLRKSWRGLHGGAGNNHNPPVLEDDLKLKPLGISFKDSQWIEARNFQAVEICRFFRVPPHMVGILDRATFSNIEEQSLEFVIYTLGPWCVRFEQSYDRDLVLDRAAYYTRHNVDGLLRGNITARYAAYTAGIQAGWLTRNEVRRKEDLNPLPGLDTPLEPTNMAPAGSREEGGGATEDGGRRPPPDDQDEEPAADERASPPPAESKARDAFDVLLKDAAGRIAAAEIRGLESRAQKAAENPQRFAVWVADYYSHQHKDYALRVLEPLARAWAVHAGREIRHGIACGKMAGAADIALAGGNVLEVLARWRHTRSAECLAILRDEFFRQHEDAEVRR